MLREAMLELQKKTAL